MNIPITDHLRSYIRSATDGNMTALARKAGLQRPDAFCRLLREEKSTWLSGRNAAALARALGLSVDDLVKVACGFLPGEQEEHPCKRAPPWLVEICRRWEEIDEKHRVALEVVARGAVGGSDLAAKDGGQVKAG